MFSASSPPCHLLTVAQICLHAPYSFGLIDIYLISEMIP